MDSLPSYLKPVESVKGNDTQVTYTCIQVMLGMLLVLFGFIFMLFV